MPYFRIKQSLFGEQNEVKREFVGVSSGLSWQSASLRLNSFKMRF
ncbi:hypothetical protein RGC53_04885 [Helicobacter pylori]|uniref:Uncharacterized protein n=1 Tax=Helicobacter pylori TaxID=210 RepID=A0AAW8XDA0_HELPX|nr:hypothetical protein [Helicobacter pylori]MDU9790160.1 hypothetical protein [Helicobacter pylori]